ETTASTTPGRAEEPQASSAATSPLPGQPGEGSDNETAASTTPGRAEEPQASSAGTHPETSGQSATMTDGERIDALDGQLAASLAVFDGMILGERAAAAAMADRDPGAMAGGGGTDPNGTEGDSEGDGAGGPLFEEG